MLNYNYHTHTTLSNHATGSAEEYIKRAVENGIKYMGFSDHMAFAFPDGSESPFRVPVSKAVAYCEEIKRLGEKYSRDIKIRVGFEMEYYPQYFDTMLKNAIAYGAEYLILGQHFNEPENTGANHTITETTDANELRKYASCVISAMKTGAFSYVAHPDIFNFTGDADIYRTEVRKICVASGELAIPLEINFLGIREGRNYPNDIFWQVAGEEKAPVVFGFDAHDTKSAFDGQSLIKAEEMVRKYNLNYIAEPELILIQK